MNHLDGTSIKILLLLAGAEQQRESEAQINRSLSGTRESRDRAYTALERRGWIQRSSQPGAQSDAVCLTAAGRVELSRLELPPLGRYSGALVNGLLRFLTRSPGAFEEAETASREDVCESPRLDERAHPAESEPRPLHLAGSRGASREVEVVAAASSVESPRAGCLVAANGTPLGFAEANEASSSSAPAPPSYETFKDELLDLHMRLDVEGSCQGMVPIHRLRDCLPAVPRDHFDRWLIRMDTERLISLDKITNTRETTELQRAGALQHPYRGLLYYVSRRGHYVRQ